MNSNIMSSIFEDFDTDYKQHTKQYSNNNTHLEYLDLSITSEDELEPPIGRRNSGLHSSVDAEFYSFDDYNPESSHYDQVYDDLISLLRQDEIKTSQTIHHNPPRINRSKQKTTRRAVKSYTEVECDFCDDQPIRLTHHDSDSSSSTVTTSSQSSWYNLSFDRRNYENDGGLIKRVESRIANNKKVSELHAHKTDLLNRTQSHMIQYTPSENSVPLHDGLHINGVKPMIMMDVDQIHTEPIKQKNTQPNTDDSQRTEELLNGIVKLVKEDIKKPQRKKEKVLLRRTDRPLKSSKSTPMLNINNKTESLPAQQNKKVSFVRRSSIVANTALEYFENRKSEKKSKSSLHSHALFDAVEHFELEKVVQILNTDSSTINAVNSDGFTVLDIAVLTNHVPLTKTLIKYNAKCQFLETYRNEHDLLVHLQSLIQESKQQVVSLSVKITSTSNNSQIKDSGKKLNQCEFKHRLFRRMKNGYEQAGTPGQPQNVRLNVSSATSLRVKFDAPEAINGAVVTKYKVEWSCAQNFKPLAGEVILSDIQNLEYEIPGLDKGIPYFVKVTAWNLKGFGRSATPDPSFATPSSWADVEMVECRFSCYNSIKVRDIGNLVKKYRSTLDAETSSQGSESPPQQRKNSVIVKKGLSRLFSSSAKFQKTIKRGVYLSCIFQNEDKILVTSEDNLPIIEVDESYSSTAVQTDYDWLMKVSATQWDIARTMKQDMERLSNVGSLLLRSQLLSAIIQLQNMLGIVDLGHLYFKPLKDSNGSLIFVTINQLTDPKQIGNMASVKWQTQNKLMKSASSVDTLINSIPELLSFTQSSAESLEPGLYLGYLHVKINVESLKVLVPNHKPTVPPHIKIRDCPNVSQPEWDSLLNISLSNDSHSQYKDTPNTLQFKKLIIKAAKRLFHSLDLPLDQIREHRIYDVEVLEFSKDVSFIMLVPSRDLVCTIQSNGNQGLKEMVHYLDVPVKAFEMIHQRTYQDDFITNYSRVACLVDSQLLIAQQSVREAFDSHEVEAARNQLEIIKTYQKQLEEIWRGTRWLMDVIAYARDKATQGIPLSHLISLVGEYRQHQCETTSKISDDGYHSDKLSLGGSTGSDKLHTLNVQTNTNNNNVGTSYNEPTPVPQSQNVQHEQLGPGVLRVYAAYHSGLAKGTSVLLHVTTRSTAREVIDLVVMQLNQAVVSKGMTGPIYKEEHLEDFCLAAVVGVRERVLRDDYRLLQLQNPWIHGRLYVRMKDNLLAALEHGEITTV